MQRMKKDVSRYQHKECGTAMPEKADHEVEDMGEEPQRHDRDHYRANDQNPRTDMSKIDHHFHFPF